jgi:hypothetical protein
MSINRPHITSNTIAIQQEITHGNAFSSSLRRRNCREIVRVELPICSFRQREHASSPEFDGLKVARLRDDMAEFARRNNFIPLLSQGEIRILN